MLPIALFAYAFALWLGAYLLARWVAGSAALVFGDWLPLTTAGIWIIVVLADIVAVFAVLQFIGIRRLARKG